MITVSDVQNYTLTEIESQFQPQIETWIEAITTHIEKVTQRKFEVDTQPEEKLFDGNDRTILLVDDFTEITTIELGDKSITSDVIVYPANSVPKYKLFYKERFTEGNQNIKINAKWGTEATEDVKLACTILVSGIVQNQNKLAGDIVQEKIGDYQVSYTQEQFADFKRAMEILASYRNYSI